MLLTCNNKPSGQITWGNEEVATAPQKEAKDMGAFRSHSTWQTMEDDMENERYKDEQRENLKNMAELKLDLLSRAVLMRNVLPLGVKENQIKLRNFMESQYGPIQKMPIDKKVKRKQFSRGRVTFNFKRDVEKIFGATLQQASKE